MIEAIEQPSKNVKPIIRLGILVFGLIALIWISYSLTGTIFPSDNRQANIFQSGLLMVILGSLFLEDKFTRPIDAVINALTGGISLITVYSVTNDIWWDGLFGYCVVIFLTAIICVALGVPGESSGWRKVISQLLYNFSTRLGNSRILFSIIFLYSVFSYYGFQSYQSGVLVLFWGVYIAIWPLKIPNIFQSLFVRGTELPNRCGTIIRMEDPDLVLVELKPSVKWSSEHLFLACTGENEPKIVLPLFSQVQNNRLVGTGLCLDRPESEIKQISCGGLYDLSEIQGNTSEEVKKFFQLKANTLPVGLVSEGSTIGKIKFETWPSANLSEGLLVFSIINGSQIFYQVIEGNTRNEELTNNKHGFFVAEAIQLGTLDPVQGFLKYPWLPGINSAVFLVTENLAPEPPMLQPGDFILGNTPSSKIPIIANIHDLRSHHLAILGTTGRGKTELAFDLIRISIENETRVFCVDLTLQYAQKLNHLHPNLLSLTDDQCIQLGAKIFEAETGDYGGGKEKRTLEQFINGLRESIDKTVTEFLQDEQPKLGLFNLPAISNTRSTIQITELYLSAIFNYAKSHPNCKPIWIILEEAHTLTPETKTMGLSDYHSQAVVGKISQIALQGRKYNVGLMVIAQRTATVSKTVLTQCNSVISFSIYDQTGLDFLANIFGNDYINIIPNLGFLQAIAFGKGIKSMRPLVVGIPKKDMTKPEVQETQKDDAKE